MLDLFCMSSLIRNIVVIVLLAICNASFAQNPKPNTSPLLDELMEVRSPEENKIYHIEHFWESDDYMYVVLQEIKATKKKKIFDGRTIVDVETIGKPIVFAIKGKVPSTFLFFYGSLFVSDGKVYFYNLSSEKSQLL